MPEWIDPAWEYWQPSEEMLELYEGNCGKGNPEDTLMDLWNRVVKKRANLGFRISKFDKNLDKPYLKLARERPRAPEKPELPPVECKTCKIIFKPDREGRSYCSRSCTPHRGSQRRLEDKTCPICQRIFRPREAVRVFCSPACVAKSQIGRKNPSVKEKELIQDFARRFTRGDSMAHIISQLGISLATAKRWRRKLKLPARPAGKYSRKRGKPTMKVGDIVLLVPEDNPLLDGKLATIEKLESWGAHVKTDVGTGKYRAAWSEMEEVAMPIVQPPSREMGYTGDICNRCGSSKMIRNGSCLLCTECGDTSGCT